MAPRVRFAPSPTGYLHLGSARSALFNWLYARHTDGTLVLRIEDTDRERSSQEMIDLILRTFDWLGIEFDEGPYHQSERGQLYLDAAEKLFAAGQAYYCDLTPAEIAERTGGQGYDGYSRDRGLGPGPGRVLRFRVPDEGATVVRDVIRGDVEFEHADLEDFVIVRSDGSPVFLLANAVDDADMAISHVVRGEDLLNTTPKVLLLWEALGYGEPPVYAHLPLIVNDQGKKLSKRRDDVAVEDYRARGYLPEAMVNYLALLGWGPRDDVEVRPVAEIIEQFELTDISKGSARFDPKKLEHVNGEKIRALPLDELLALARPYVEAADWFDAASFDEERWQAVGPLVQERARTLADVPSVIDFLFLADPQVDEASWEKIMVKGPDAAGVLDDAIAAYADAEWTTDVLHETLRSLGEGRDLKLGKAQAPVRVAVTGRTVGPPLFEALELLGRDETLRRLEAARQRL
ncbi:MAG: glutamate--tRNA ligase [Actinomycetota bacterium]